MTMKKKKKQQRSYTTNNVVCAVRAHIPAFHVSNQKWNRRKKNRRRIIVIVGPCDCDAPYSRRTNFLRFYLVLAVCPCRSAGRNCWICRSALVHACNQQITLFSKRMPIHWSKKKIDRNIRSQFGIMARQAFCYPARWSCSMFMRFRMCIDAYCLLSMQRCFCCQNEEKEGERSKNRRKLHRKIKHKVENLLALLLFIGTYEICVHALCIPMFCI